ncbi:ABC transporter permease [Streptomyces antnestii]|uniref:ABC transporter permease n=1 Tax=Streptomyces antnestii TaxID=2494256 RepID=A0A3S2WIV1_9ACTN|nr:ABC transporter permease [Streptomyces sp. San01]RVU23700.1 ABC transporter permease [Streptomyces sp. San01]
MTTTLEANASKARPSVGVRRFRGVLRHRVPTVIAVLMVAAFAVITVAGDKLAPMDAGAQHLRGRLLPPGSRTAAGSHLFGTDALGRDLWSLVLAGAQTIVVQAALAVVIGTAVGALLGLYCGYRGGRLGDLLILLTNLQLSFPFFLLALAVVGILGASFWLVVFVVALASWVEIARVVHIETREVCQLEYILAVRVMRGSGLRIVFRHILPNVASSILVLGALAFGNAIVIISGLGFIGLSAPSASPGWGEILSDGRDYMASAWWITITPGIAIFLLVLSVNIISEAVRDRLSPN